MKFKDKNGKVFDGIHFAVMAFCPAVKKLNCVDNCPLYGFHQGNCYDFCTDSPVAAAHLMGYEVIEDNRIESDTVKGVEIDQVKNQVKPLKDWTLEEIKEYCRSRRCEKCSFCDGKSAGKFVCKFTAHVPSVWGLSEKPRFTDEEIADAKALVRIFPDKFDAIRRCDEEI